MGNSSSTEEDKAKSSSTKEEKYSDKKKKLEEEMIDYHFNQILAQAKLKGKKQDEGVAKGMASIAAYQTLYNHLNKGSGDTEGSNILMLAEPMLYVASLIYTLAALRVVLKEDKGDNFKDKQDILAGSEGEVRFSNKIKPSALYQFLEKNESLLDEKMEKKFSIDLNVRAIIGLQGLKNSYIYNFDDNEQSSEMVYGICVNETQKRITVVFRGTDTTTDLLTDINASKAKETIPKELRQKNGENEIVEEMLIHKGFHDYLTQKMKTIVEKLEEIFDDEKNRKKNGEYFDLFVTGHSLGGALATFAAFKLATHQDLQKYLAKPVICISFASPYVGDQNWANAFEALEKQGRVRHIRFCNEKDWIPAIPSRFFLGLPWTSLVHTGMHIFLHADKEEYEVGRGTPENQVFWWHLGGGLKDGVFEKQSPTYHHGNDVAWKRMHKKEVEPSLKNHTITTLYAQNEKGEYEYAESKTYPAEYSPLETV